MPQPAAPKSLFRRPLPLPSVPFNDSTFFKSSMASSYCVSYFPLVSHFVTQSEPAFCGLSTLVTILNALEIDPRRQWNNSVWRYFEESMLSCCEDLEGVKKRGITFNTFCCLARCNGLKVSAVHGTDGTLEEFRNVVKACTAGRTDLLAVSYDRSVLNQTGTGHFSPIGAYDPESDHVLILDVARFKYPPHWTPLESLFQSMQTLDRSTSKSRGYAVLSDASSATSPSESTSSITDSALFNINVLSEEFVGAVRDGDISLICAMLSSKQKPVETSEIVEVDRRIGEIRSSEIFASLNDEGRGEGSVIECENDVNCGNGCVETALQISVPTQVKRAIIIMALNGLGQGLAEVDVMREVFLQVRK